MRAETIYKSESCTISKIYVFFQNSNCKIEIINRKELEENNDNKIEIDFVEEWNKKLA